MSGSPDRTPRVILGQHPFETKASLFLTGAPRKHVVSPHFPATAIQLDEFQLTSV
jgi:hypothetical protein